MDPQTDFVFSPEIGQKIYDFLMSRIHPELCSSMRPLLKDKYQNETPEERSARAAGYEQAFQAYDQSYANFIRLFKDKVNSMKRDITRSAEADNQVNDQAAMQTLESMMNNV